MSTTTEPRRPSRRLKFPWSWQGAVALILAAAIVCGITILCFGVAFRVQGTPIPEQLAGLLTAVISGIVGILGTFLGRFGSGSGGHDSNAGSSAEQRQAKKAAPDAQA